jgi:hypothetical protein
LQHRALTGADLQHTLHTGQARQVAGEVVHVVEQPPIGVGQRRFQRTGRAAHQRTHSHEDSLRGIGIGRQRATINQIRPGAGGLEPAVLLPVRAMKLA